MILKVGNQRTSDETILVDDQDYELIKEYSWYVLRMPRDDHLQKYVRAVTSYYKEGKITHAREVYLHRFIMQPPKGMVVDHINGNGLDNRRVNLRVVTPSQNVRNRVHTHLISGSPKRKARAMYAEGYTSQEIASEMGWGIGTVRKWLKSP